MKEEINVLCIVGETRSGSTIVDRVLGTLDGVQSLCELDYFWVSGLKNNDSCSCGESFRDCDFWKDIVAELFTDIDDIEHIMTLRDEVTPSRHFLKLLTNTYSAEFAQKLEEYRYWIGALYRVLAGKTGSSIFVDSSKGVNVPLILGGIPGINVHVLHVVRDVRGFVYSLQKGNINPAFKGKMATRSSLSGASGWLVRNIFCEMLKQKFPYQRLVYDNLMRNPELSLSAAIGKIPVLDGLKLKFNEDNSINLPAIHTIGGNPHRFVDGRTSLRVDDEWRKNLSKNDRFIATVIGYPLLFRYGLS